MFALALSGVPTSATAAPAGLVALESDLAAEGVTYVDRFGNTDQSRADELDADVPDGDRRGGPGGRVELRAGAGVHPGGEHVNVSYFDFSVANGNYQGTGAVGDVTNIAVVPEPTSLGLLGLGALGLVGGRRSRNRRAK